jgi:hypothetical protein
MPILMCSHCSNKLVLTSFFEDIFGFSHSQIDATKPIHLCEQNRELTMSIVNATLSCVSCNFFVSYSTLLHRPPLRFHCV